MLPPRAPVGREASLTRVRGWRLTWMPGTLGASMREPSKRRRSHRPLTPPPTPQEPSPCVAAGASLAYLQRQASRRLL